MARGKPATWAAFFTYSDGHSVPWESLSYEERVAINKTWIERLESAMPAVFAKHPESLDLYEETEADVEEYYRFFPEKRNDRKNAVTNT